MFPVEPTVAQDTGLCPPTVRLNC